MTRTLTLALLAAAAIGAAEQVHKNPADRIAAVFNHIDADKDGAISKQEWMPLRTRYADNRLKQDNPKAFDKADTNDDGRLSQEEIWSFPHWPGFDRFDADRNGSISRAEWDALAGELRKAWQAKRDVAR